MADVAEDCEWEKLVPYDITCATYNASLITETYYTQPGHPIVLPAAINSETKASRLAREITRRLGVTTDEQIYVIKGMRAQMPFGSPTYKTDPNTGAKSPDPAGTDMHIEGTDYRANKEMYEFWKAKTNNSQQNLCFFKAGKELVVGEESANGDCSGILATFASTTGLIESGEYAKRLAFTIDWKGDANPDFAAIAL